jgi:DNA-binding HxlR family transcriptional regulator
LQHYIKKQIIQLDLYNKRDSFHIQHLVSGNYLKNIIPILQKVFDSVSDENEMIIVDRLEIDLGVITFKDIEQGKWAGKLEQVLKEVLTQMLLSSASDSIVHRQTNPKNNFRQWMQYMESGHLPWNLLELTEAWYEQILQLLATDITSISALRQNILHNRSCRKRIIWQHPVSFLIPLIETLTAKKQDLLPVAIKELTEIFHFIYRHSTDASPKQYPEEEVLPGNFDWAIWEYVLKLAAKNEMNTTTEKITESILTEYIHETVIIQKIKKILPQTIQVTRPVLDNLYRTLRDLKKVKVNPDEKSNRNKKRESPEENESLVKLPPSVSEKEKYAEGKANPPKEEQNSLSSPLKTLDEEGIFVQHAGMVLLHPFLNTFFRRLHLVEENEFTKHAARLKAMHLLYFMCTGNLYPAEHELVITKLLCNFPLINPVERDSALSDIELNEANELLEAVIAQWDILKNSSVTALREGFLQRSGKLFTNKGRLYLQVEKSAIDILLDHLPWNISMIKLPWMQELLQVDWR